VNELLLLLLLLRMKLKNPQKLQCNGAHDKTKPLNPPPPQFNVHVARQHPTPPIFLHAKKRRSSMAAGEARHTSHLTPHALDVTLHTSHLTPNINSPFLFEIPHTSRASAFISSPFTLHPSQITLHKSPFT
jgi:hypothetical protein